jgi:hypothetical protein
MLSTVMFCIRVSPTEPFLRKDVQSQPRREQGEPLKW